MKKIFQFLTSIVLLGIALYILDWDILKLALLKLDFWSFIFAVAIALVIFFVLAMRWYLIIQPIAPLPLVEHLAYYFYGSFLNFLTPANIGGDLYRYVSLRAWNLGGYPVFTALIWERLLGMFTYLISYLICLVLLWQTTTNQILLHLEFYFYAGWVVLAVIFFIFLFPFLIVLPMTQIPWIRTYHLPDKNFAQLRKAMKCNSLQVMPYLLGYSALGILLWILVVKIVALNLGLAISLPVLGLVVTLTELVRLVPISLQGIGLREGAFSYLLILLGEDPEAGFVLGAVSYLALSCAVILSGLLGWGLSYLKFSKSNS